MMPQAAPPTAVVLISGRGSNLQAIIDTAQAGSLPLRICAVISNRPNAVGLNAARRAQSPTRVVDHTNFASRELFDRELAKTIDEYSPDIVIMAGFMRLLTADFVNRYRGKLVNIHPSLLPAYKGLDTHARALHDSVREHGASVHFVTPDLDGGPVLMQVKVPVRERDTAERLAQRVLSAEHKLYPAALALIASGRVEVGEHELRVDGEPLTHPLILPYTDADDSN